MLNIHMLSYLFSSQKAYEWNTIVFPIFYINIKICPDINGKLKGRKLVFSYCVFFILVSSLTWAFRLGTCLQAMASWIYLPPTLEIHFPTASNLLRSCSGLLTQTLSPLSIMLLSSWHWFPSLAMVCQKSWALQIMMVPSTTSVQGPYLRASLQDSHSAGLASATSPR